MEAALAAYNQSLCSKDRFTFIGGDLLTRSAFREMPNSEEQRPGCIGGYPK
jgi:hypothetical protein